MRKRTKRTKKSARHHKVRYAKKVKRATRKIARLTSEQLAIRKAEKQALQDYLTKQRFSGLVALDKTWKLPRFRKLAKRAASYLAKLSATLGELKRDFQWLRKIA